MLKPVHNKVDFPKLEEEILNLWKKEETFFRSMEQRKNAREYVFYDGPPFATGLPHYGHLLAGTIKDIVPRYQTMRGYYVARRFGWDCHGLPIEALAQEALGLAGAAAINEKGIDVFNEQCRSMVMTYVEEWRKTVTRMGRWVDMDHDYKTMDLDFMESVWWVFKQLWDKDMIYKAHRIMLYSWKLTTPLSNFEAGSNYKDVDDPAITVRLRMRSYDPDLENEQGVYALIWTTTPWTLPGNLALCAGPDIVYVAVRDRDGGEVYLLAKARLAAYYQKEEEYELLKRFKGTDLLGWEYEPLFPYFADHPHAFRILNDAFVTTEDGAGIVHLAPAYGEDDYRVCKREEIALVDPLDMECNFTDALPEYTGQFCKAADKAIIRRLKKEQKLVHQSTLRHSYPFCDRTDTPLIYRAIDAWYVKVEEMRDRLVVHNDTVHWVPAHVGDKRFGNWLKEARDWNISRNRFWGSCIPVWIAEDQSEMICVGSARELEELSGERVTDLHKHVIDNITFEKDGKLFKRTPEVLDGWFESGSMPYGQFHYPFENKERFESHFPADFIAEGLDQTRGWFYTLSILSTALFDRPAFKNCVVNGLVLAEDGRKMSKRLKNYPDPTLILDTYGADALRLYLIDSPVVRADDLCFSEEGVKHALRHFLIPLWNAYSFFVTYARIDGWTPETSVTGGSGNLLDRWILSALERLTQEVVMAMDGYELQSAVQPFVHFIEDLTNWYIRRSRRRFWKSSDDEDKQQAYTTLYAVLLRLAKIAAPFVPFISEAIYRNLKTDDMPDSVHLCDFPLAGEGARNEALEKQMEAVISVVGMGRLLRSEHNLKVRRSLSMFHVICREAVRLDQVRVLEAVIADELNVKEVAFSADEGKLVHLKAKAQFGRLGPRLGPRVKEVAKAINGLERSALEGLLNGDTVRLSLKGEEIELAPEDVVIERIPQTGWAVASEGPFVVALETELSDELVQEGLAREFVNKVQQMRKAADLDVVQRIVIFYRTEEALLHNAVLTHSNYIKNETLGVSLEQDEQKAAAGTRWELNGHDCMIRIETA